MHDYMSSGVYGYILQLEQAVWQYLIGDQSKGFARKCSDLFLMFVPADSAELDQVGQGYG